METRSRRTRQSFKQTPSFAAMEADSETQIETKKKKSKKRQAEIEVLQEHTDMEQDSETQIETNKNKKKKREKSDVEIQVLHEHPDGETQIEAEEEKKNKKKKKKKREKPDAEIEVLHEHPDGETQIEAEEENKKKKKKKREKPDAKIQILHENPDSETQIEAEEEKLEEVNLKIQVINENLDKIAPLIGYFPSGFDPHKNHSYQHEPPRVKVLRKMSKRNHSWLQLALSPNGSKVDFVGTSYSGEAATHQACNHALGVLDKETRTLKFVPIASNKIFRLEPRVAGSDSSDKELLSLSNEERTEVSMASRIRELTQLYGTKKSITAANKMDSLQQKVDPSSQEDLDRKIKRVVINKEALESTAAPTARNIPPYDSSATTPQQAYPLDKIILKGEWDYLLDILELLQAGMELARDSYPSFVHNRIHKLGDIQDEEEKQQLACIFSYITHLIKFKDQHSMDGASSAKNHKIPKILRQKFSTLFAETESKRLSDEKNALLISYVLVLTLYADGFRTDPSDVARDLRMSPVTLRVHYEHLGCKFKRENNLTMATLPVPLQFPKLRQKRRR